MWLPLVAAVFLLVALGGRDNEVSAYPRLCNYLSPLQMQPEAIDPSRCQYGWALDVCGRRACAKGPGELCGGKHRRYGICGEGLMCSNCNRCQGCSLRTFQCFDDRHCIRPN